MKKIMIDEFVDVAVVEDVEAGKNLQVNNAIVDTEIIEGVEFGGAESEFDIDMDMDMDNISSTEFKHNYDELYAQVSEECDVEYGKEKVDPHYVGKGLTMYLNDIGRYPLLSAEQEFELYEIIKKGGSEAVEARNKLVTSNLRLVHFYAKKYVGRGVDIEDLNLMGVEGLIKAAERFDATVGCKFSTYASLWIQQAITRGIADEGSTIRIPVHKNEHIRKIKYVMAEFYQLNDREPSIEEICELTNLTENQVTDALDAIYSTVSFDARVGEDGDSTLEDFLSDENAANPCDMAVKDGLKAAMREALGFLTEKEALVLKLRNGIGCDSVMTLEQIAKLPEFNVSRERVRQIEEKAYRKLRRDPHVLKLLRDYVA